MIGAAFPGLRRLLCLGAHSDDIEIGAGGTVLRLLAERPDVAVRWVVFSAAPDRAVEARASAARFLEGCRDATVEVLDFPDGLFPTRFAELKAVFAGLKAFSPDLVLTHRIDDRHQDHRTLGELTWQAFRDHAVLEYEIMKFEGDLVPPNLYAPLDPDLLERKVAILMECFASQRQRHWFDADTFKALARLRGLECGHRFAEAFHARKLTLAL